MSQPRVAVPATPGGAVQPGQAELPNKWMGIARSIATFLAIQAGGYFCKVLETKLISSHEIWDEIRRIPCSASVCINQADGQLGMSSSTPATPAPSAVPEVSTSSGVAAPATPVKAVIAEPLWDLGTPMSMLLYTSLSEIPYGLADAKPVIRWDGLTYGNYADVRAETLSLDVPQAVRTGNASWWMDVVLVKDGGEIKGKAQEDVAVYTKRA